MRDKLKTKLFKLNLGHLTSDLDADFLSELEKSPPCYERKRFRKNSGFPVKKLETAKNGPNLATQTRRKTLLQSILPSKLSAYEM